MRALCLTEPDRAENPLELREDFQELCRSEFVEIYDKAEVRKKHCFFRNRITVVLLPTTLPRQVHVKFSGNLLKCEVISAAAAAADKAALEAAVAVDDTKSIVAGSVAGATLSFMGGTGTITFRPFSDNRQAYLLKRRNEKNPYPKGRVTFFTGVAGSGAERPLFEAKIDLTKFLVEHR